MTVLSKQVTDNQNPLYLNLLTVRVQDGLKLNPQVESFAHVVRESATLLRGASQADLETISRKVAKELFKVNDLAKGKEFSHGQLEDLRQTALTLVRADLNPPK